MKSKAKYMKPCFSVLFFACFLVILNPSISQAWSFPEHVVLTEEGTKHLPQFTKQELLRQFVSLKTAIPKLSICGLIKDNFLSSGDDEDVNAKSCVPYGALPALAADHSNDASELYKIIESGHAATLVNAARLNWIDLAELKKQDAFVDSMRRTHARKLDTFFTFNDPGYISRAVGNTTHFDALEEDLDDVLKQLAPKGRTNNNLNQFVIHHLRSLQLAALSRGEGPDKAKLKAMAFIEHGFALHFLEDAFAAGHLAVNKTILELANSRGRLRQHDFFNRNGFPVTRALSPISCSYIRMVGSYKSIKDPKTICWTTYGDAYLGKGDGEDIAHAAQANSWAQIQFVMALNPEIAKPYLDNKYTTINS